MPDPQIAGLIDRSVDHVYAYMDTSAYSTDREQEKGHSKLDNVR